MRFTTKGLPGGIVASATLFFGLILGGCSGSSDPATSTSSNTTPIAVDDAFTVVKGSTMIFDLASNDSDADNGIDPATITIVQGADYGSVSVNSDGTVEYSHDGSDSPADTFRYTIMDQGTAVSNTAAVAISVLPVAPPAVQAGIYDSTVVEGADDLEFVISLATASTVTVSIDYASVDGSALGNSDYLAANGIVQFAPGEVRKFVTVPVPTNKSAASATSKSMQLVLSNPQYAVLSPGTATGTIIDRDMMSMDSAYDTNWGSTGAFSGAAGCERSCHRSDGSRMASNGADVSPGTQWKHSVMANAFNDPYWQAAVEDEVESFPHLAGLIEDTCTTCHAPMGRMHARHTGSGLDSDGYYRLDTAVNENHAREGVSCTLCHQIDAGNLGDPASFSGSYVIADSASSTYKFIYGPYGSPVGNNMEMQTGHRPTEGTHIAGSALCATCHTLYTPALDPETGMPSGISFLEQGPYLEWQNSIYSTGQALEAQCQDCHMPEPEPGYSTAISLMPGSAPSRTPYGQHTLLGGNAHLLEILRDFRASLGIADSTSTTGFDRQIAQTRAFLAGAANLSVSALQQVDDSLRFDIEVTNNAGHKLPSAYPSRRMWLHVSVKNGAGEVIFESGAPDARGYLSTDMARLKADCMAIDKLAGFDSSLCFEPHRNVINDPSQVAIYETVLGDANGEITHTLLHGAQYLKDNRIPPAGFLNSVAATIEPQTVPAGVAGDADFNCAVTAEGCGADSVHYQVNIEGQTGPYTVESRLLYQATQPGFVDGMHTDGDRVNRFKVMYDTVPPSVEVLATASG